MTISEYIKLKAQVAVLKEIAEEYPCKTIENIIVQIQSRLKEVDNIATKL